MRIEPVHDNILVRPVKQQHKTPGGIMLPDTAKTKDRMGMVLEVGPGKLHASPDGSLVRLPMCCKKGDKIMYARYAGSDVREQLHRQGAESDDDLMIGDSDVLAIVKE